MRCTGVVPPDLCAEPLVAWLAAERGLETELRPEGSGASLWVLDEDRWQEGRRELARWRSDPAQPRYRVAHEAALLETAARAQAQREEAERARRRARRRELRRRRLEQGMAWRRPLTLLLMAASVGVALSLPAPPFFEGSPLVETLGFALGRGDGGGILGGQLWRLVTPIFVHVSVLHLLFNLLWLHDLGSQFEALRGSRRFATLVLAIAAASNFLVHSLTGSGFVGLSGVVYGLLGHVAVRARLDTDSGLRLPRGCLLAMGAWAALCAAGLFGEHVAIAQVAGFLTGVLTGLGQTAWRRLRVQGEG